nr:MAG TPA: hypothetical protein [Caudoviricetes sp.]
MRSSRSSNHSSLLKKFRTLILTNSDHTAIM